jgi:GH25 family lysozyme M1 (1,4-beta-N-acetylmuramidase)
MLHHVSAPCVTYAHKADMLDSFAFPPCFPVGVMRQYFSRDMLLMYAASCSLINLGLSHFIDLYFCPLTQNHTFLQSLSHSQERIKYASYFLLTPTQITCHTASEAVRCEASIFRQAENLIT